MITIGIDKIEDYNTPFIEHESVFVSSEDIKHDEIIEAINTINTPADIPLDIPIVPYENEAQVSPLKPPTSSKTPIILSNKLSKNLKPFVAICGIVALIFIVKKILK